MEGVLQKFQHLVIQPEEIISATNNFDDVNRIGVGGFGSVYKGEVSHSGGRSMVAIKRLDRRHGQGEAEFLKEIDTLSRYRHKNLISLLGFCYQGDDAILVYELASRGSLDRYLNSPHLTWSKRIKICLDAAKGLGYLHDPRGTHQRLIHCDVKGGNILLDDQWNAKIADFGFSIMGPANEQQSTVITLAAGTHGYIDPLYMMTNTLTKESDVYSFGVVLFEVLCGRLCCTYSNGRVQQILVPTWIESYKQKKLNDIIFKDPNIQAMDQSALEIFSDIAYRCLKESREDRPKMAEVVMELETALEIQELFESKEIEHQDFTGEFNKQHSYYEKITKSAEPPLNYRSEEELWKILCEGVLLNSGKMWFLLNKKGEHCEMVSLAECLDPGPSEFDGWLSTYNSRFPMGNYYSRDGKFKTRVKTQFLSPGITYTVNLVFRFHIPEEATKCKHIVLNYKLQGEIESSIAYLAYAREDGWWTTELYQFTSDHRIISLQILFEGFHISHTSIEAEGIEFRPLEKVEHKDDNQPISNSDLDANWEEKMPTDYEDIIKRSKNSVQWTTKEEAYSIIRKGFLISDDKTERGIWFSLNKSGKKCHMLPASLIWRWFIGGKQQSRLFLPESRFGEAIQCEFQYNFIKTEVQSQLVSSETTYAVYLVYKLLEDQSGLDAPIRVEDTKYSGSNDNYWYIYIVSPQTPVIRPKVDQDTHNPLNKPVIRGLPQQRNDGWMEVQIWKFHTATTMEMDLTLKVCGYKRFSGLIIEGFEFRPI